MASIVEYGQGFEDSASTYMARIEGADGSAVQQADVTGITCKVFDMNSASPTTAVLEPSLVVSTVIFDTLQTDSRWTKDATGYNFLHAMPPTAFPEQSRYRIEYLVDPASGDDFFVAFEVDTTRVLTS